MKQNNHSRITLGQYLRGMDELANRFIHWLEEQTTWLTPEQIQRISKAPPERIAIALKAVEHDPRVVLYRKDNCTWYRASTRMKGKHSELINGR